MESGRDASFNLDDGVSTLTELSQVYWPRGVFAGRFDPLDILAYGCGLAVCYVADKVSRESPPNDERRL